MLALLRRFTRKDAPPSTADGDGALSFDLAARPAAKAPVSGTKSTVVPKQPAGSTRLAPASAKAPASEALRALIAQGTKPHTIMSFDEIPPHGEVLTGDKGRFEIPKDLRDCLAAVSRLGEESSAIVLVERSLTDLAIASDLEGRMERAGLKVQTLLCDPAIIRQVYNRNDARKTNTSEGSEDKSQQRRKFNQLIRDGLKERASDIQIHRHFTRVEIKFMVNGDWRVVQTVPFEDATNFMRAIYDTIAGSEKASAFNEREAQDAVATVFCPKENGGPDMLVRVRIHTQPEQGGFCMYLRILPVDTQDVKPKPFEVFGYEPFQAKALIRMSRTAEGALLFVGTTGSGKTTSLHNCMLHISEAYAGRKNIITVEDPPEIYLPHAHQTFVDSSRKDGGWGGSMRSAMRSVPDFVMVGEIRDEEPAQLVVDMTLSGHGLLSSLHAGDAFQAVDRLAEMGVRPTTLANPKFLTGIVYQRLLPVLCPDCKVPYAPSVDKADPYETDLYDRWEKASVLLQYQGKLKDVFVRSGKHRETREQCKRCAGQGTVGRTVAAEVVTLGQLNLEYYDYFRTNRVAEARDLWIARGGYTALHHGSNKVLKGLVDPHDIEGKLGPLELITRYSNLVAEYKKTHGVIPLTQRIVANTPATPAGVPQAHLKLANGEEISGEVTVTKTPDGQYLVNFVKADEQGRRSAP
jgi:type II secretory ATPase GspE/PulE/Tfp pilus assembly ATPase PilB-like protein